MQWMFRHCEVPLALLLMKCELLELGNSFNSLNDKTMKQRRAKRRRRVQRGGGPISVPPFSRKCGRWSRPCSPDNQPTTLRAFQVKLGVSIIRAQFKRSSHFCVRSRFGILIHNRFHQSYEWARAYTPHRNLVVTRGMPRACTRIVNRSLNVRFSPKADKYQRVSVSPLCATSKLMHCNIRRAASSSIWSFEPPRPR